jgi:ribonuclease PH
VIPATDGAPPRGQVARRTSASSRAGRLDLDFTQDSRAEVDFNVVGTDVGTYVELQGTAEGKPFGRPAMDELLDLAASGLERLFAAQAEAIARVRR